MKLTKAILLVTAFVALVAPFQATAADYPTHELFLGFRYMNIEGDLNGYGWGTSYAYNFNKYFGLAGQIGGVYGSHNGSGFDLHDFLVGPRLTARGDQLNLFGHALIGGGVASASSLGSGGGFVFAVGGGLDYNLNKSLSLRLAQVEYVGLVDGGMANSVRVQTGVVFKFGY